MKICTLLILTIVTWSDTKKKYYADVVEEIITKV